MDVLERTATSPTSPSRGSAGLLARPWPISIRDHAAGRRRPAAAGGRPGGSLLVGRRASLADVRLVPTPGGGRGGLTSPPIPAPAGCRVEQGLKSPPDPLCLWAGDPPTGAMKRPRPSQWSPPLSVIPTRSCLGQHRPRHPPGAIRAPAGETPAFLRTPRPPSTRDIRASPTRSKGAAHPRQRPRSRPLPRSERRRHGAW